MFIKEVRKRNGKTPKVYKYLHLVESVRTEKGPRQELILNLGSLDIEPSQYKALAQRIEDIITGQQSFTEVDEKIEKHARNAAEGIFKKRSQKEEEKKEQEAEYEMVNVKSMETEIHRGLGAEYLCDSVWKKLEMDKYLINNGVSKYVLPVIEGLVIGRLIDPGSERYTKEWAENRTAMYEITGEPLRNSLNSYYRAGDTIYSLKDGIEKYLSRKEKDLFSLSEKIILIDLTNTHFEGECLNNRKAKRGKSKQKRSDCKLVTLGLIIDESGFVKYSELFEGNQSEPETLQQMINSMEGNITSPVEDRTIVIDAGIATKENINWLKSKDNYHYIVVNRGKAPMEIDYEDMEVIKEDEEKGIKIEVKRYEQEEEVYIVCRSQQKVKKEESMRRRVEKLFIERLEYYKGGLTKPRRTKKYTRVVEMIGRLKEKYPKAGKLYKVEVIPEEKKGKVSRLFAKDIKWEKKELHEKEVTKEGSYILRSDRLDLNNEEIWKIYRMLGKIEEAFKNMKSHLGIRPNFHQKENRVDTHMFISVLAYHLLNIIEQQMKSKGDRRSWKTIRNVLSTHERVTIEYQSKDEQGNKKQNYIRINSKLEPEHLDIYRKFGLSGVPLPKIKMSN